MSYTLTILPYRDVNSYLLHCAGNGFVLIDSGYSKSRPEILKALEKAGCRPGNLKLILITHGDFDHTGNAAYLRNQFKAPIAMHADDVSMVERGELMGKRRIGLFIKLLSRIFAVLPFFSLNKKDRFTPDLLIEDGFDLTEYGLEAKVIRLPGHSPGSLGVLTASGDLFCGDFLMGGQKPRYSSVYVDRPVADTTLTKLKQFNITAVYPGHGSYFEWNKI